MEILDRITKIRQAKNLSVYNLANKCGLSRNAIYQWYSKNFCPSLDAITLICEKGFEMSLEEFFTYGSKTITLSDEYKNLIDNYKLLTAEEKKSLLVILNGLAKK